MVSIIFLWGFLSNNGLLQCASIKNATFFHKIIDQLEQAFGPCLGKSKLYECIELNNAKCMVGGNFLTTRTMTTFWFQVLDIYVEFTTINVVISATHNNYENLCLPLLWYIIMIATISIIEAHVIY
jgi:hypothetical protein